MLPGGDEEDRFIDPETVDGYKRTVLCEGVRDEIAHNLGPTPAALHQLLQGMTNRRLLPTPWLNQVLSRTSAITLFGALCLPVQTSRDATVRC